MSTAGPSRETISPMAAPVAAASSTTQLQSLPALFSGPITPYQSVRSFQGLPAAPQGHPSAVPGVSAASATQPFLGFNNIGVNLTGQVNPA